MVNLQMVDKAAPRRSTKLKWGLFIVIAIGLWIGHLGWTRYRIAKFHLAAESARRQSDWGNVATIANLWLEADRDSAAALLYAADAAQNRGSTTQAVTFLDRVSTRDSLYVAALQQRALLLFGPLNQPLQAEATLRDVIARDPNAIEARRELLRYYGLTCQGSLARQIARDSIAMDADSPATFVYLMAFDLVIYDDGSVKNRRWLSSGDDDELFAVAAAIHESNSARLGDEADMMVASETRQKQLAMLRQQLTKLLERYPSNPELLANLLGEFSDEGNTVEMAQLLAQVPASAGGDARFWRYKGMLHQLRDEPVKAEEAFRGAIQRDSFDWKSRHQLAQVLRQLGRSDQAESFLKVAAAGSELRKTILTLPGMSSLSPDVLKQMQNYAEMVGEDSVATQLARRLDISAHPSGANP